MGYFSSVFLLVLWVVLWAGFSFGFLIVSSIAKRLIGRESSDDFDVISLTIGSLATLAAMWLGFTRVVALDGFLVALEASYFSSIFSAGAFIIFVITTTLNEAVHRVVGLVFVVILAVFGNIGVIVATVFPGPWFGGRASGWVISPVEFIAGFCIFLGTAMAVTGIDPLSQRYQQEARAVVVLSGLIGGLASITTSWFTTLFNGVTVVLLCGGALALAGFLTKILTQPSI